jgi:hypothetical protein
MQFPPDIVYGDPGFDPMAAGAENEEIVPGLAERFEPDAPGMHTTDSVDYGIVLDGHPVLELDDGQTKSLNPGDIVVQNGTRHAWRNPTDTPTTILLGVQPAMGKPVSRNFSGGLPPHWLMAPSPAPQSLGW